MGKLGTLDISVFISYLVFVTIIGFVAGRKKKESASDYFIAAGKLPWYLIGFSMLASNISTEQFIGSCGAAYKWGMPVLNWELSNFVVLLMVIWVFIPIYLQNRIVTIPQYLELRFGNTSRGIYAMVSLFSIIFIMLAGVLYTGGFILEQILGINKISGIWSMVILAGAYTVYGGLISVAWTQLLQGILLLGGGLLVAVLGIINVDGGFSGIIGTGVRSHLIQPISHPELPWTAILVLTIPVNIWYWCTNQAMIQSSLGAKSPWHSGMGVILLGFLIILASLTIEFPGLIAYALNPNLENVDNAYLFVVKTLVPSGLKGLILAGLMAAMMSTIQALAQSASTLFTLELYSKTKKSASDANLIRTGRISCTFVLILGALWAPMVGGFPSIFEFFAKTYFFFAAPVAAVFIAGIFWKRATSTAAVWTLLLCFPLLVFPYLIRIAKQTYGLEINEYNLAGVVFMVSIVFVFIVSLITQPPGKEQIDGLVWKPSMVKINVSEFKDSSALHKKIWVWSAIYLTIMVVIYVLYW
ncbi:MAG: sodium/solute symporter [Cyclobacteriaceae bacterium]